MHLGTQNAARSSNCIRKGASQLCESISELESVSLSARKRISECIRTANTLVVRLNELSTLAVRHRCGGIWFESWLTTFTIKLGS